MLDQATKTMPAADALIAERPEPVRRYLRHALPAGLPATSGVRLRMTGKIKVGLLAPVHGCAGL